MGHLVYQQTSDCTYPVCSHIASVRIISATEIKVHSQLALKVPPTIHGKFSLRAVLSTMLPCIFLCGLTLTGDGEWLLQSFRQGSLITCHDGSFMPGLNDTYCSAATLFLCKKSGNIATITYCEKTARDTASNYRDSLVALQPLSYFAH